MTKRVLTKNLMASTATSTLAMFMVVGAPSVASADAIVDLDFGASTGSAAATIVAEEYQQQTGTVTGSVADNLFDLTMTASGTVTMDSVTGTLENNSTAAPATGTTTQAAVTEGVSPDTGTDTVAIAILQESQATVEALSSGNTATLIVEGENAIDDVTFIGTVVVDNNDMSATATGNKGVASITVDPGVSMAGIGSGASVDIDELNDDSSARGNLVISAAQQTESTVQAISQGDDVRASLQHVSGSSVTMQNSDISATATGNDYTSSLDMSDTGVNEVAASAALAAFQDQSGSVTAMVGGSDVRLYTGVSEQWGPYEGDTAASDLAIKSNTQSASATGNDSSQTLSMSANILGSNTGLATADDSNGLGVQLEASGDAVVASVQKQTGSVLAEVSGNQIIADIYDEGGVMWDTTVTVSSNAQTADAMGATAANRLDLSGNDVSTTGAVVAVQSNDGSVVADVTDNDIKIVTNAEDIDSGGVSLTDNTQSATATGVNSSNILTLSANNYSVDANSGGVSTVLDANELTQSALADVSGAVIVVNDQSSSSGTVRATVWDGDIDLDVMSSGGIADINYSALVNDRNTQSATANGQTTSNGMSLEFTNLTGSAATNANATTTAVAVVSNGQSIEDSSVLAENHSSDGESITTTVEEDVANSSISTSSNTVSADATGNLATLNSVTVNATNMIAGSGGNDQAYVFASGGVLQISDASISVANAQDFTNSSVTASQVEGGSGSNWIWTNVSGGDVFNSTVKSDDNTLSVASTANAATNLTRLGNDETATIQATSAVGNYQAVLSSDVVAEIGVQGTDSIQSFVSSNGGTGSGTGYLQIVGNDVVVSSGSYTLNFDSALTADEATYLNNIWGTSLSIGATSVTLSPGNYDVTTFSSNNVATGSGGFGTGDETWTYAGYNAAGSYGDPNLAGVVVELGGPDIIDSTVTVAGNTISGAVTGNTASNFVLAEATNLESIDSGGFIPNAVVADTLSAEAEHVLRSEQHVDSLSTMTSDVYGTFAILQAEDQDVSGSTLGVTGNTQTSAATANDVSNVLALSGTNVSADSALLSRQLSSGAVATSSDLEILANAAMSGSTLALSDNTNTSTATQNDGTNTLTVSAANAWSDDGITGNALIDANGAGSSVDADHALVSMQSSLNSGAVSGSVVATATTDVYNRDAFDVTPGAITNSTVGMDGNTTLAAATVNTVNNSVALDAGNLSQTAALLNGQYSANAVVATSSSSVELAQQTTSSTLDLVDSSTASVDGNTSTARAIGNTATNTFTASGTNIDGGATNTDATLSMPGSSNSSDYALYNDQQSVGVVSAESIVNSYRVDLSADTASGGSLATVLNSAVSASSNVSAAYATSNSASNTMTIGDGSTATLSSNAGVVNQQLNDALVTSNASSTVQVTVDTAGTIFGSALNGSSVTVDGNSTIAMSRGNVASNVLNVESVNADGGFVANASVDSVAGTVQATYGILNTQTNDGAIVAEANDTIYQAALNQGLSAGDAAAATGSSVSVSGNNIQAYAYANIATNTLTLTSLNEASDDATVAVGNFQYSNAPVESSISGSHIGANSLGAMTGTRVTVGGNSLTSTAVGNYAVTTITRN